MRVELTQAELSRLCSVRGATIKKLEEEKKFLEETIECLNKEVRDLEDSRNSQADRAFHLCNYLNRVKNELKDDEVNINEVRNGIEDFLLTV